MDCQISTKRGFIKCKYFGRCQTLKVCLCEVEPYEDGTLSPLPRQRRPKKRPWAERRQEVLQFAKENKVIDTTMIMEHTGAARVTACNWLRWLTNTGDLQRLSNAVLSSTGSRPATFAIHKED